MILTIILAISNNLGFITTGCNSQIYIGENGQSQGTDYRGAYNTLAFTPLLNFENSWVNILQVDV